MDAARRRGGILIVWLSWLTDSAVLWRRQDETAYLMEPDPLPLATSSSTNMADGEGEEGRGTRGGGGREEGWWW